MLYIIALSFVLFIKNYDYFQCSKSCDSGTQKRTVKCLEPNIKEKQMKESQNCRYAERQVAYRNCNTQVCTEKETNVDPRVDLLQNDVAGKFKIIF